MTDPIIRCTMSLVFGSIALVQFSCTSTSGISERSLSPVSKNWRKIAQDTTIYYPVNYIPKGELDYRKGDWVYASTALFFIPKDGTSTASRNQLTSEALAFRKIYGSRPSAPSDATNRIDPPSYGDFIAVLAVPVKVAIATAVTLHGGDPTKIDFEQ